MQVDQHILYAVILVFCALVLLLISMIIVYLRLVKKLTEIKEGDSGQGRVEDANIQARKIIESANNKAKEIIANAQVFNSEEKKIFEENINKSIQMYADQYNQVLENSQNELVKVLSNIPRDIREDVGNQLNNFNRLLQAEVVNSQQTLRGGVETIFQNTKSEIEQYKVQSINQLNNSIIRVVEEVSKRVLAKQINLDEQQKLVMKALEEAKRRMGLSSLEQEENQQNG